jgi:hypothetical protein
MTGSYFLKLPGDTKPREYSAYEIREFLGQGVITPETLVWSEGMEDWRPLGELETFQEKKASLPSETGVHETEIEEEAEGVLESPDPVLPLRHPLLFWSKLAFPSAIVTMLNMAWVAWFMFVTPPIESTMDFSQVMRIAQTALETIPPTLYPVILTLSFLLLPAMIIQAIWIFQSCVNIRPLGIPGLRFIPIVSVIMSCLPTVGFLLNAMIMRDLYKVSTSSDLHRWVMTPVPSSLRYYFISSLLWVISSFFSPFHHTTLFSMNLVLLVVMQVCWAISVRQITQALYKRAGIKRKEIS